MEFIVSLYGGQIMKYFIFILFLFFISCDDDFPDPDLRGHYYIKSEYPVIISINDLHEDDKLYIVASEIDYYFTVYQLKKLHTSCIKITSDVEQNIHVEMRFKTYKVTTDDVRVFDVYDDSFEYCY